MKYSSKKREKEISWFVRSSHCEFHSTSSNNGKNSHKIPIITVLFDYFLDKVRIQNLTDQGLHVDSKIGRMLCRRKKRIAKAVVFGIV